MIAMMWMACGSPAQPEIPPPPPAEHHHDEPHEAAPAPAGGATPSGLSDAVQTLSKQRDQIKALLDAGKLSEIHEVCEQMDKTAALVASQADGLQPSDKVTVSVTAVEMKSVLDALHDAADAGNTKGATEQLGKLDADLAKLQPYR